VDANSSRWHEVTPSSFDHEQAALRYVRDLLRGHHSYPAWSNFTFVSDHGHIREVDLHLVGEGRIVTSGQRRGMRYLLS